MNDIATQMQSLYSQYGELAGISIELHKELIAITVENQAATACVFLQGAQISHYSHSDQPAILWLSPCCDYRAGQPLRGGIPICWPWFGELDKNPAPVRQQINSDNTPAHGFVRNRDWQLADVSIINPALTRLCLKLDIAAGEEALWPFATQLQLNIEIGNQLKISLEITNRDSRSFHFSAALHSYFALSDITAIHIDGLDDKPFVDSLDHWQQKQQQGPITFTGEVDRIYQQLEDPITLIDPDQQTTITVQAEGSNSAVIWNPWCDKAKTLSQFTDDAYRQMVCIETANALDDCIELAPGNSHCLGANISIS